MTEVEYVIWRVLEFDDYWCCQKNVDHKPTGFVANGYATPEEALAALRRQEDSDG